MSPDFDSIFKSLNLQWPLAIVGMGLSGNSCLRLLVAAGIPRSQILSFDESKLADFHSPEELLQIGKPKTLCVSPGVSLETPWVKDFLESGGNLTSELEIAFAFLTSEKIIAVTGSVGKSTTVAMIGSGAPNSFVGGNYGVPLADYVTALVQGKRQPADFIVLELSSYQLENFSNYRSDVAILTSLNPNHLERYPNKESYYQTKLRIFSSNSHLKIANASGGDIAFVKDPTILKIDRKSIPKSSVGSLSGHNLDNLSLALKVADFYGWPNEKILAFKGLQHRMENCGVHKEVLFINDSKATTMDSVLQAHLSTRDHFPKKIIHLLLGGRDKNLPWTELSSLKSDQNTQFWFFGEFGAQAQEKSTLKGTVFRTLSACLDELQMKVKMDEIVLLSPGGTSLDEFKNFEDRGNFFKDWISTKF
jgi:UDP-N-acetylmuramoylalanine--D-glutamate ligase